MLDRKRVSTDTITGITSSPDFTDAEGVLPAPSAKQLIKQIKNQLATAAKKTSDALLDFPADEKLKVTQARLLDQIKEFDIIVKNIPTGFDLVPVLYDRIAQDENEKISDEYIFQVRQKFLIFVAENHVEDLKSLGICEYGIGRMKLGLDASDKDGHFYDLSIDHIIERSGSGLWAESKAVDPDQPDEAPRYRTNHFGNFILLPEKIHQFKNTLNTLQKTGVLQDGDAQWMLMMIPKRDAEFSGFVCAPQKPDYPLYGIDMRPPDTNRKISHVAFTAAQANEVISRILRHPEIAANDDQPNPQDTLRKIFNGASAKDPALHRDIAVIKPQLAETARLMKDLFNEVSSKKSTPQERNDYDAFTKFFAGRKISSLRTGAAKLPFKEAVVLQKTIDEVGGNIEKARAEHMKTLGRPKPVNDDQLQPETGQKGTTVVPQYGKQPRK